MRTEKLKYSVTISDSYLWETGNDLILVKFGCKKPRVYNHEEYKRMISWKMISRVCPAAALMIAATGPTLAELVGVASYYGKGFHGRRAANGEVFDMHAMTVAHKSLPFGTKLQVTNMSNGRSVVVRVQDRGPYIRGRVLDLSYGAAQAIGMIQSGTAKVKYAKL